MRTVEQIKEDLLSRLGGPQEVQSHWEQELKKAYTAEGVLDAMMKGLGFLMAKKFIDRAWLEEAFPLHKLQERGIFISDDPDEKRVLEHGDAWFFGRMKVEIRGEKAHAHLFEQTSAQAHEGKVFLYDRTECEAVGPVYIEADGHAKVVAREDGYVMAFGQSDCQVYGHSLLNLYDRSTGYAKDQAKVDATDHSRCIIEGDTEGRFYWSSVFWAKGNATVTAYDEARGLVEENADAALYGESVIQLRKTETGKASACLMEINPKVTEIGECMKSWVDKVFAPEKTKAGMKR